MSMLDKATSAETLEQCDVCGEVSRPGHTRFHNAVIHKLHDRIAKLEAELAELKKPRILGGDF